MDRDKNKSFEEKLDHIQHKARLITDKPSKTAQLGALLQSQTLPARKPSKEPAIKEGHRYLQRIGSEKEIDALFEQLKQEATTAVTRRFVATAAADNAKWITKAVQPHFQHVTKQALFTAESSYPATVKALFSTASALIKGEFGDKLRDAVTSHLEQETHIDNILRLTLFQVARHQLPIDIFDQKLLKNLYPALKDLDNIDLEAILLGGELSSNQNAAQSKINALLRTVSLEPDVLSSFQHLFQLFVENCLYPSSLMIQQLLRMNLVDQAIEGLHELKNTNEKSKSIELIITSLLDHHLFKKAIELWNQLTTRPERMRQGEKIVEAMLEKGEDALAFCLSLENGEERDNLLRISAMWLTHHHKLDQAHAAVGKIQDKDIQNYAKSNLVHILARQNQFQKAKEIALSIADRGYREDAILDVVKAYLQIRHVDDAIKFVDSIKNPYEKDKPAKVIAAALKSHHQDEKVRNVRQIFALLPAPIRNAA